MGLVKVPMDVKMFQQQQQQQQQERTLKRMICKQYEDSASEQVRVIIASMAQQQQGNSLVPNQQVQTPVDHKRKGDGRDTASASDPQLKVRRMNTFLVQQTGSSASAASHETIDVDQPEPIAKLVRKVLKCGSKGEVRYALKQLREQAVVSDNQKDAITSAGGVLATIEAIKNFANHPGVLSFCFDLLNKLSFGTSNDNKKLAIADADGIDLILRALKTHAHSRNTLGCAFRLLVNLSVLPEICARIASTENSIKILLFVMDANLKDASLQMVACSLLHNLARGSRIAKQDIIDNGGRSAVAQVMDFHRKPGERSNVDTACSPLLAFLLEP